MTEEEARQPRQYCTNCGAQGKPGDAFCVSCGAPLIPETEERGPQRQQETQPRRRNEDGRSAGDKVSAKAGILLTSFALVFLLLVYLLGYSLIVGVLLLIASLLAVALIRQVTGSQTRFERRVFEEALGKGIPSGSGGSRSKTALLAVFGGAATLLLISLVPSLRSGPDYEVVYEKDMSYMVVSMSGYDYLDHNGLVYIKVEVERPEDIDAVYEDLTGHPKVEERDCVVIDFFVKGDRRGEPVEGRVIEGNSSCGDDVKRYEERMGSFAETSDVDDVYGDEVLRGVEHPDGW